MSGTQIDLSWTVQNVGAGATQAGSWRDRAYLSTDTIRDDTDLLLGSWTRTGALDPGQAYTQNAPVQLPDGLDGTYYILVQTDVNDDVIELSGESNNVTSARADVQLSPYADLAVTAPDGAQRAVHRQSGADRPLLDRGQPGDGAGPGRPLDRSRRPLEGSRL